MDNTSITVPTVYNAIRYGIINVKIEDTRRMKEIIKYKPYEKNTLPASKIPYSIDSRTKEVNNKIIQIKNYVNKHFYKIFKSFSTDNGSEFSGLISLFSNSKTSIYFCHPYCSGEKGTNEKHNSLIRYFIPKKH